MDMHELFVEKVLNQPRRALAFYLIVLVLLWVQVWRVGWPVPLDEPNAQWRSRPTDVAEHISYAGDFQRGTPTALPLVLFGRVGGGRHVWHSLTGITDLPDLPRYAFAGRHFDLAYMFSSAPGERTVGQWVGVLDDKRRREIVYLNQQFVTGTVLPTLKLAGDYRPSMTARELWRYDFALMFAMLWASPILVLILHKLVRDPRPLLRLVGIKD